MFKRLGAFITREYNYVPPALRRGFESVAFTGAGVGVGSALNAYSNLPFAHTPTGQVIGILTVTPLLRMIQMYLISRANVAKVESGLPIPTPSVPANVPIPGSQTQSEPHHL